MLAGERAEDLDGVGAAFGVRDVMVARQHDDGDAALDEASQALGELALLGLVRVARLVGVPGEQGQFDAGGQRGVDGRLSASRKSTRRELRPVAGSKRP